MDEKFNALTTATLLTQPASYRQAVTNDWLEGIPFLELVMCAALTQVAGILDVLLERLGSSKIENK